MDVQRQVSVQNVNLATRVGTVRLYNVFLTVENVRNHSHVINVTRDINNQTVSRHLHNKKQNNCSVTPLSSIVRKGVVNFQIFATNAMMDITVVSATLNTNATPQDVERSSHLTNRHKNSIQHPNPPPTNNKTNQHTSK